jgi:acyl-CoA reductase-like NAD-dependent aldehyde dehydrogenase
MEFQNYIGGKWVNGRGDGTFDTINPTNEEILACIHAADVGDVDAAVQAAQKAFESWRLTPAPLRGEFLLKMEIHLCGLLRKASKGPD